MPARKLVPLLAASVVAKLALDHIADADVFFHLRLGLDALATRRLPTTLSYSWSLPGVPRLPIDWLAQLFLAAAYRLGGFPGVGLLKGALTVALVLLVHAIVRRRSGDNPRAGALVLALFVAAASTQFFARPLAFGALLLAGVIWLLDRIAAGRSREAFLLPLVFALWPNTYGGWPVGLGLTGAALADALLPFAWGPFRAAGLAPEARRRLAVGFALSLPALLLNPSGLALVVRPFWLLRHRAALSVFDEWSPVPWTSPGLWALLIMAALLLLAGVRGKGPLRPYDLPILAASFVMALRSANQHLVCAIVAAPALAGPLGAWFSPEGFLENRRVNAAVAALAMLLFGAIGVERLRAWPMDIRTAAPVEAVEALECAGLAGTRGFAYFDWGGYLVFRRIDTYVDGRLEPFLDSGIFDRYLEVERTGDMAWLEANQVRWLLEKARSPLDRAAEGRPGWHLGYRDQGSVLWLRDAAAGNP